jgi:hypothetical protein
MSLNIEDRLNNKVFDTLELGSGTFKMYNNVVGASNEIFGALSRTFRSTPHERRSVFGGVFFVKTSVRINF